MKKLIVLSLALVGAVNTRHAYAMEGMEGEEAIGINVTIENTTKLEYDLRLTGEGEIGKLSSYGKETVFFPMNRSRSENSLTLKRWDGDRELYFSIAKKNGKPTLSVTIGYPDRMAGKPDLVRTLPDYVTSVKLRAVIKKGGDIELYALD